MIFIIFCLYHACGLSLINEFEHEHNYNIIKYVTVHSAIFHSFISKKLKYVEFCRNIILISIYEYTFSNKQYSYIYTYNATTYFRPMLWKHIIIGFETGDSVY